MSVEKADPKMVTNAVISGKLSFLNGLRHLRKLRRLRKPNHRPCRDSNGGEQVRGNLSFLWR